MIETNFLEMGMGHAHAAHGQNCQAWDHPIDPLVGAPVWPIRWAERTDIICRYF